MKKNIILAVIAIIVVGGICFYGGFKYAGQKQTTNVSGRGFGNGTGSGFRGGNGQRMAGEGFLTGNILSKDGDSLTISLRDGGSKIVFFSTSTIITKTASSTFDALEKDKRVMISGTQNSDGSYTAKTISLP